MTLQPGDYVLVLRPISPGRVDSGEPYPAPAQRLKRLLKTALRRDGFRVVSVEEVPQPKEKPNA